ncbi:unnamed protein product, partial [Phaeothamnion confervicola]
FTVLLENPQGTVRFFGRTYFSDGLWLGVELDTRAGRNDGMVQGHRYFHSPPNYGLFVRPGSVEVTGCNND